MIKDLGYDTSHNIKMYGEQLEIVSHPFPEAGGVAVQVVSAENPTIRTLRLPVAILIGMRDLFPIKAENQPLHPS